MSPNTIFHHRDFADLVFAAIEVIGGFFSLFFPATLPPGNDKAPDRPRLENLRSVLSSYVTDDFQKLFE
jgi:hypothetical protein